MPTLSPRSTTALRALALAASLPLFAQIAAPHPACAAQAPAAVAAPSLKLFADSKLVVRDRISVEVVGRGPDVVLIPGLASSREVWRRTAERLRGSYRLHLVQVAGFAGEPARANASGPVLDPTAAAIAAYIAETGLERPAVVGHSIGGVMALQLALDHPERVGRVMVVDSLAFYPELMAGPKASVEAVRPMVASMGTQMLAASDDAFRKSAQGSAAAMVTAPADQARLAAWTAGSWRPAVVRAMQDDMLADLRPRVGGLVAPLTVIHQASLAVLVESDYAPVKRKTLVSAAPEARHFIMYDDPSGFDAALDAFLKG